MNNYILLEKYRKKLSVYFALFVLFSFWITQAIFLLVEYIPSNLKLEKILEKRLVWVINVIQNHEKYLEKLNSEDTILWKLLLKTLENVIICEYNKQWFCDKKVIDNINEKNDYIFSVNKTFFNIGDYKYLKKKLLFDKIEYQVIIKSENEYSLWKFLTYYSYFLLFSIPFAIVFYYIWYIFVGKNFKPIKETISWLEDFTSNINHEMKTPLAEIISTLSLAKKTKKYDEAIEQSLNSSKKLNMILDSMLWIINLVDSSYKKERFDLVKELNSIIRDYSKDIEKKQITIEKKITNNSYFLTTNKQHFDICVWNILKNAIKYSEKDWIIEINFKDWVLELRDNWIWISKKNLNNIFDRYFRENYKKEEWYGIWLALVKKICDIHSWKVTLKSQKKKTINWERWTIVNISFL